MLIFYQILNLCQVFFCLPANMCRSWKCGAASWVWGSRPMRSSSEQRFSLKSLLYLFFEAKVIFLFLVHVDKQIVLFQSLLSSQFFVIVEKHQCTFHFLVFCCSCWQTKRAKITLYSMVLFLLLSCDKKRCLALDSRITIMMLVIGKSRALYWSTIILIILALTSKKILTWLCDHSDDHGGQMSSKEREIDWEIREISRQQVGREDHQIS